MRRGRDEPASEVHGPARQAMMQGFAVWRAGRPAPCPAPIRRPRRSFLDWLTGRRPADPFQMDDARVQALVAELRETHPRFELDETLPAPKGLYLSSDEAIAPPPATAPRARRG